LEFFAALPACLAGIEACPTAHYWSRQLQALGHTVRLLPPSYVKAYLKRSKNDANDTAAIRAHALLQRYSRTHAIPFGTLDVERVPLSAQKKLIAEREEEER
jgi:transposase